MRGPGTIRVVVVVVFVSSIGTMSGQGIIRFVVVVLIVFVFFVGMMSGLSELFQFSDRY